MSYSHVRFIPYHTPTIYMSGTVKHELPAGMLLDYEEQQTIFRQFPDMKVAAGLVDREQVLAQKPPIYTVNLSGQPESLKLVKSDADVFSRIQRTLTAPGAGCHYPGESQRPEKRRGAEYFCDAGVFLPPTGRTPLLYRRHV